MDVSATRLLNLKTLVSSRLEKGTTKKAVALAMDMSASFLSQLLAGKKMGDDLARKIELTLGLPHGWMDTAPSNDRIAESAAHYLSQSPRLQAQILASATKMIRLACESLEVDFNPESVEDAGLILMASDYLVDRGDDSVTADNVVDFTKRLRAKLRETDGQDQIDGAGGVGGGAG